MEVVFLAEVWTAWPLGVQVGINMKFRLRNVLIRR
jgi:hypothetical protein